MRIAMLANAASPHTKRWAEAFSGRGHEVHVLSIRSGTIRGATVHTVGPRRLGSAGALASYLLLLVTARRRLRRIGPDVVHAHYSVTHGAIAVASRIQPVVLTVWGSDVVHGDRVVGGPKRWLNRFVVRRVAAVTAASSFLLRAVADATGSGAAPGFVVPFGVDTTRFTPGEVDASTPTIGFVKGLRRRYAPDVLLEAFARLAERHPGVRLVVAGDGPLRRRIVARIRQLGLAERIDLLGTVAHDDLPGLMRRFTLLVNPSLSESFGVVVLEASACEIPVVATRVGGIAETVIDGETGVLVPPRDSAALAKAIERLLDDPVRRAELGAAGRAMVRDRYEWQACVDRMLEVLRTAA